ncbi:ABC transporter substrate-binding protein [Tessaracoccus sp. MC1756]|uniref:ABC transporter substrate-binding protein n=1 Tax=Tessaracoccus sp. MC1756 TaxID=2760311 RepID=UPI001603E16F|nr:extracellular solute-binding protein [Tessaracoccus sp. MC1756]MBB1510431.1 extracellular solute-binding protein [Tessaracoccus sp. MC1756]
MSPSPFSRLLKAAVAAAASLSMLAACAPGSDAPDETTAPADGGSSAAADPSVDPASLGDITLTVWDQEVRGSQNDALVALNEAFMEKYPNITIDRQSQSFDDLKAQVSLALSGNDVPDVVQVNNARGDMGQFVTAGQLTDLSPYAAQYGWEDRFPASVLSKVRYSPDGTTFGEGNLYGLPQTGEIVGIFYSKKKLEELGAELPTTWDEYFAILDQAKEAGEQPMILGNIEGWPAIHVFGPLMANYIEPEEAVKLGMGNAGASWVSDGNKAAMEQFATWGAEGYFGTSPNGTDYDAAWNDFTKGTGVFLPGGSWLGTDMEGVMGEDLGFMAPPPAVNGELATTGGTGIPFSIPANAENKDAAVAYIDYITSDEAMKLIAENGGFPVLGAADLAPESGVQKEIFEAFDKVSQEGTLLPYLDYATPTFSDTAGQGLQEVLGGQRSADEVLQAFEDDYKGFTGE